MLDRRTLMQISAIFAVGQITPKLALGSVLPAPQSLRDELKIALAKAYPLVVMVSLERCPFCRVARDSYLEPLRREAGVPVFQLDLHSSKQVRHFDNSTQTHDQLTSAWKVKIAPTVLFFGTQGTEIAPRLEGAYIPDFYGTYLDQRIQQARANIK